MGIDTYGVCVCVCAHWTHTHTLATHSLQFPNQATNKTPTTQHGLHYCRLPATTEWCPDPHSICSWTAGLANKPPQRMEAGGRLSYWLICRVIGWESLKQPKDINISHPVGRWGKFHGVINCWLIVPQVKARCLISGWTFCAGTFPPGRKERGVKSEEGQDTSRGEWK